MNHSPATPETRPPSLVGPDGKRRRVKHIPPPQPLEPEKRYVPVHRAHASVFTGLFAWAFLSGRDAEKPVRKPRLNSRSFGPDGLQAPTVQSRTRNQFTNYFALGTSKELKPMDFGPRLQVFRNRVVFLLIVGGICLYSLLWLLS